MFGVMIPAILSLASITSGLNYQVFPARSQQTSAASAAQIKFAVENKYDDTGPGAKGPQYAYNGYKTLDDAIIAFLDDPDTKLPEHERERALKKLTQSLPNYPNEEPVARFLPKTVEEYTGYKKTADKETLLLNKISPKKHFQPFVFQGQQLKNAEPYKVTKIHHGNYPVSVAHYSRGKDITHPYQFRLDSNSRPVELYETKPRQEEVDYSSGNSYTFHEPVTIRHSLHNDQIYLTKQQAPDALSYDQAFIGRNSEHQPPPFHFGDQLFDSRIEQGNPQYLQKRDTPGSGSTSPHRTQFH